MLGSSKTEFLFPSLKGKHFKKLLSISNHTVIYRSQVQRASSSVGFTWLVVEKLPSFVDRGGENPMVENPNVIIATLFFLYGL